MIQKKFSDLINEFSIIWFDWSAFNNKAIDKKLPAKERRKAAVNAEKILFKRYRLVKELNDFFEDVDK
tara:strand:- start:1368 stop:1571 length:204 start_codon:yes stop_codon:yes gene_type:complete